MVALLAGTLSGGAVLGLGAAFIAFLLGPLEEARLGLLLGTGVIVALAVLWPRLGQYIPERQEQVARALLPVHGRTGAALRWGFALGLGVRTYIVTPGMYLVLVAAATQSSPLAGALVCLGYGLARGATIALLSLGGEVEPDPGQLKRVMRLPLVALTGLLLLVSI